MVWGFQHVLHVLLWATRLDVYVCVSSMCVCGIMGVLYVCVYVICMNKLNSFLENKLNSFLQLRIIVKDP